MTTTNSGLKDAAPNAVAMMPIAKRVGLVLVFLWFTIGGVAHFALTGLEMSIVPPYIPWPRAAVLISGVFELLGALGILIPVTRRAAGVGLFLLTIAVTPANVYMLQHAELFNLPRWGLIARLPFQVALLALIIWSTWNAGQARVDRPRDKSHVDKSHIDKSHIDKSRVDRPLDKSHVDRPRADRSRVDS
jgi:uncharacterized membrane protein